MMEPPRRSRIMSTGALSLLSTPRLPALPPRREFKVAAGKAGIDSPSPCWFGSCSKLVFLLAQLSSFRESAALPCDSTMYQAMSHRTELASARRWNGQARPFSLLSFSFASLFCHHKYRMLSAAQSTRVAARRLAHIRLVSCTRLSFAAAAAAAAAASRADRHSQASTAAAPSLPPVYIVGASRTPVGVAFKGGLATVPAVQLGIAAVQGALKQSGVAAANVEDCYFGQVLQAGAGQSPARQVALGAGCPNETEATTINKVGSQSKAGRVIYKRTDMWL